VRVNPGLKVRKSLGMAAVRVANNFSREFKSVL